MRKRRHPTADTINPTQLQPGAAAAAEIERLARASVGGDDREQSLALLELLTHLSLADGITATTWAATARKAVMAASAEILYEAADLVVANEQRKRGGKR